MFARVLGAECSGGGLVCLNTGRFTSPSYRRAKRIVPSPPPPPGPTSTDRKMHSVFSELGQSHRALHSPELHRRLYLFMMFNFITLPFKFNICTISYFSLPHNLCVVSYTIFEPQITSDVGTHSLSNMCKIM